jgi:elongation factor G
MHNKHENNKIHNISFVGKDGTGKSKLVNAILKLKSKKKESEIVEYPEEIERGYTIYNRFYHFDRGDFAYNLIDTPGNTNFLPKIKTAAAVSNGAVILISPTSPNDSAFRIWQRVAESNTPRVMFINGLDEPEAKFEKAIDDIEVAFSTKPAVLQMPWYEDGKLTGVIDVIRKKLVKGVPGKLKEEDAPESVNDELELLRATTIERLAEMDDELMELYIEETEPPMELLLKVLAQGVADCTVTPLLVGSARENIGIETLCDFIETYFSPFDQQPGFGGKAAKTPEAELVERKPDRNEPFCGRVFKTLYDRYAGKLSFVQIISGTLAKGTKVINIEDNNKLTIGRISVISGETTEEVDVAYPGDIVVLEKEDSLSANQTLCDPGNPVILDPINYLKARYTKKLIMTNSSKDSRIMDALHKVVAEDPGLRISTNKDTKEILFSGTGIMHVDVTKEHLNNAYDVEIELGTPALGFHETITRPSTVQGKYKKQSGGHGQYGDVHIKVEPLPRGGDFEFVNAIVGGAVPRNYIPSVEKGVKEGLLTGSMGGFPVVDVKVTLFDGSYHAVDSSDFAFQAAGLMAIKKALPESRPVILEPVMEVDIDVAEEDVGKISKDIASRRGKINNYNYGEFSSIVNADIPLSEMQDYTPSLRGLTQGMGLFKMKLSSYEILASNIAEKLVAANKKEEE